MLVAKNQETQLGNLPFGKPFKFNIELTNESDTSLNINKIVLGCNACTQASIPKNILAPREKTEINVTFTPGSTGINVKSIEVIYNTNQHLKLKFKSVVNK